MKKTPTFYTIAGFNTCTFLIITSLFLIIHIETIAQDQDYKIREIWHSDDPPRDSIEDDRIFTRVDEQPDFPGGYEKMVKYIQKNMSYPPDARKKGIDGTVYVQFIVERDGTISSVRTIRGISASCDNEAERVIRSMPKWIPGKQMVNQLQ